jgi:hypothetical protein
VGLRAVLDAVMKKKIPSPRRESNKTFFLYWLETFSLTLKEEHRPMVMRTKKTRNSRKVEGIT